MSETKKGLTKLKTGKFSRTLNFLGMVAKGGQEALNYKISSQITKKSKEFLAAELLNKQIELVAKKFGNLKGGLMKVGQMLSVYGEYFLPPETNKILKNLQYKSMPFSWESIESVLKNEFSEKIFEELKIEKNPLASASLGQVHRAKITSTDTEIVLKIQYPGVDKAVMSDISALKTVLNIADFFPQVSHLDLLFEEVQYMLKQELDYINEMSWTQKYKSILKNNKNYIIPSVFPEYTNTKIIATSYEPGTDVDSDTIKNLPLERRNQLALKVLELYFLELFQWGFVQTDPHIGNYKIRLNENGNDQIILYDFGAVREFTPLFLKNYQNLLKAALKKDPSLLEQAALDLQFIRPEDPRKLKDLFSEFCYLMVEPFDGKSYDWSQTDLPKRLTKMVGQVITEFHVRAPPREVVFLDRKTTGVFIFLSILGANINARELLEKYLDDNK